MAYNYLPTNTYQAPVYPYYQQPQQAGFLPPQVIQPQNTQVVTQQTGPTNTNIIWAEDEKFVDGYPVAIGNTVILIDYGFKTAYKKATDLTGKPLPTEIYDLVLRSPKSEEVVPEKTIDPSVFITKDDFNKFKSVVKKKLEELADADREMVVVRKKNKAPIIVDADTEVINESGADV